MTFLECCKTCLDNKNFVREFNRLTGNELGVKQTGINAMIDKSCNYNADEKAMSEFVDWVYKLVWEPALNDYKNKNGLK